MKQCPAPAAGAPKHGARGVRAEWPSGARRTAHATEVWLNVDLHLRLHEQGIEAAQDAAPSAQEPFASLAPFHHCSN